MDNLSLLPLVLKRRAVPAIVTIVSAVVVGLVHALTVEPIYKSTTRLVVDDQSVSVSDLGKAISDLQSSVPSGANLLATQSELIKSERVLQRALDQLSSDQINDEPPKSISNLRRNLNIKIIPATNILELSYTHPNSQVAAVVLNKIAAAAVAEGVDSVRSEARSVREFLEYKVPQQESKLRAAEEAESQYRQATGIVALDAQTESLVSSLTSIESQERDLLAQLQEARVRDILLQDVTGVDSLERAYTSVRVGQNADINQLEAQLLAIESAVIESQSRLGPQHPELLALLEQREELRNLYKQILTKIISSSTAQTDQAASDPISQDLISQYIIGSIERNALEEKLGSIQSEKSELVNRLAQIPQYQQPLASLVREREEAANSLSLLKNKLEEARIAEAQIVNNIRLIDTADVPNSPTNSPIASLVIATAAGAVLAIGVILLLEATDNRLHDAEEIEALFDLSVLGILPKQLPHTPEPSGIESLLHQLQWTEPYRLLLKNLEFRNQDKPNIFVISGLQDNEGQTLTTAHLSAVAAHMHRRSLVIDANWQQPFQHLFFGVGLHPGLNQILQQPSYSVLSQFQSSIVPNLEVVPCGATSSSSSNLSETPKMLDFINAVSKQYEFIAISAPPVASCADAATLSCYGAGLVLVVQANVTSRSLLKRTLAELGKSGTPVLGLVMAQTLDPTKEEYPYLETTNYRIPSKASSIYSDLASGQA